VKKAFIFDMDGVLTDSEREWTRIGYDDLLKEFFGSELWNTVPVNSGMSIGSIFDAFVKAGFQGNYDDFYQKNIELGKQVYSTVPLSEGVEDLIDHLHENNYQIGVVSSSPSHWIKELTSRLRNNNKITYKLSVDRDPNFRPKPAPDGYIEAMKRLGVVAENTYILEDSSVGIEAGKASGATVICYTAYHESTSPQGADQYLSRMADIPAQLAKSTSP
jgi:HAD superfamily hydrolase (TIGR01509 family)